MRPQHPRRDRLPLIAGLTAGIFALDLFVPHGPSIGLLYLLPLLLTGTAARRSQPYQVAAVSSVLSAIGFVASPLGFSLPLALINYLMDVGVLWLAATMLVRRGDDERRLRQSEERHRAIAELTTDYAYAAAIDADGLERALWLTPAFARVTGYAPEELAARGSWVNLVHPDDRRAIEAHRTRVRAGEASTAEFRIVTKAGDVRWLRNYDRPVRDDDGRVVRVYGGAQDITDRKQAEEALRASEEKFRIMAEATGAAVLLYERERITYANPAAAAMTGFRRDELLAMTLWDLIHPDFHEYLRDRRRAQERGEPVARRVEVRLASKGGEDLWVDYSAGFIAVDGATLGIGTAFDITQRKRAEEQLAERENRLRTIVESEPECVKLVARDGTLLEMNRAGLAMLEADSLEQLRGREIAERVVPEYRAAFRALIGRIFAGESGSLEFEVVGLRGTRRCLETHAAPLRDAGGAVVALLGITRDVTENRRVTAALRDSEERLARAQAVARLGSWDLDVATRTGSWSAEMFRICGRDPAARPPTYDEFMDMVHPDDRPRLLEMAAIDPGLVDGRTDFRIVRPDGGVRWLEVRMESDGGGTNPPTHLLGTAQDITERKEAERALAEKEHLLSESQRISHVGSWTLEPGGRIIWTDEMYRIYGLAPDFPLSVDALLDVTHPEDRAAAREWLAACVAGQAPEPLVYRVVRPDGSLRIVSVRGEPTAGAGAPTSVTGTAQDVTAARQAAQALRDSEERLRLALDAAHLGTFDWDMDGNHITWSRWHEELWGFRPGEFDGTYEALAERIHPDEQPGIQAEVARCTAAREPFAREFRVVWPDGSVHWIQGRGEFSFDAAGRPVRMRGAVVETTARRQAEEALRESEARLREAQRNAHIGSWRYVPDQPLDWSEEMYELFKAPRDAPVTYDLIEAAIHPEDRAASDLAAFQAALATGITDLEGEYRVVWPDGQVRTLYSLGEVHRDADGRVIEAIGTVQDVTERTQAERDRARLQAELQRQESMAAMGALVGGVAHEVRNPLFAISATLDAFEARFGAQAAEHLRVLREQIQRLNGVMRDLLEYGRPHGLDPMPSSLGDLVREAISSCAALADQGRVAIAVEETASCPPLALDRDRMRQVIENLTQNAVQLSPAGGQVHIRTRAVADNGRRLVECEITDQGPGFRPEDLPHVFEPYFSRRPGGTGLGLAIAQRIVEQHGGTISAANRREGGAVMTLRLPVDARP